MGRRTPMQTRAIGFARSQGIALVGLDSRLLGARRRGTIRGGGCLRVVLRRLVGVMLVVLAGCGEDPQPRPAGERAARRLEGGCHGPGELSPRGTLSLGVAEPEPQVFVARGSRTVVWEAPDPYCGEPQVWVLQHVDGWVEVEPHVERFGASRYSIQPSAGWEIGETYRVGVLWRHPHPNMRRCAREPIWTEVGAR